MEYFKALSKKIKKIENKRTIIIISLVVLIIFLIRIYIAFQSENFNDESSYFHLRQIENIRNTGVPLYEDPLSYGGKTYVFQPLLHYIIAFFSLFTSVTIAAKIIINLISVSIIIVVFLIVKHITQNDDIAIFTSFISAFTPLIFISTINSISTMPLAVLLMLLLIYNFLMINTKKNSLSFIIIMLLYILTDPSVVIFIIAIITYLFLSWLQGFEITKGELELSIFSVLIITWSILLFYQDSLIMHGLDILTKNVPTPIIDSLYSKEFLFDSFMLIGIIPLIAGIIIIYLYIFYIRKRDVYFLIGPTIMIFLLIILKIIDTKDGLIFLSIFMILLMGEALNLLLNYASKIRFKWVPTMILLIFSIIFLFGSVIPTVNSAYKATDNDIADKIEALKMIKEINTEQKAVATSTKDGHLASYVTSAPNIMDDNFINTKDIDNRYSDLQTIYTSAISTKSIELLDKYDAEYILLTKNSNEEFNTTRLSYENDACFSLIYNSTTTKLYYFRCEAVKNG